MILTASLKWHALFDLCHTVFKQFLGIKKETVSVTQKKRK